jgi:hypothetical protein
MRSEPNVRLEQRRIAGPRGSHYGGFQLGPLRFIVAAGGGWDHVSVSAPRRLPTWTEMDAVKRLVFRDDEIVMQLHVNDARKINLAEHCLHLWRPQSTEEIAANRARWEASGEPWPFGELAAAGSIPLPPSELV